MDVHEDEVRRPVDDVLKRRLAGSVGAGNLVAKPRKCFAEGKRRDALVLHHHDPWRWHPLCTDAAPENRPVDPLSTTDHTFTRY